MTHAVVTGLTVRNLLVLSARARRGDPGPATLRRGTGSWLLMCNPCFASTTPDFRLRVGQHPPLCVATVQECDCRKPGAGIYQLRLCLWGYRPVCGERRGRVMTWPSLIVLSWFDLFPGSCMMWQGALSSAWMVARQAWARRVCRSAAVAKNGGVLCTRLSAACWGRHTAHLAVDSISTKRQYVVETKVGSAVALARARWSLGWGTCPQAHSRAV